MKRRDVLVPCPRCGGEGKIRRYNADGIRSDRRRRIIAMAEAGATVRQIAEAERVTHQSVRAALEYHGVVAPSGLPDRHICGVVCQVVAAMPPPVVVPDVIRACAKRGVAVTPGRLYRIKRAHPETRWATKAEALGHERFCGDRCRRILAALRRGEVPLGRYASASDLDRLRVYHPDWPWPEKRTHAANGAKP